MRIGRDNFGSVMLPEKAGDGCKGKTKKCFLAGNIDLNFADMKIGISYNEYFEFQMSNY